MIDYQLVKNTQLSFTIERETRNMVIGMVFDRLEQMHDRVCAKTVSAVRKLLRQKIKECRENWPRRCNDS